MERIKEIANLIEIQLDKESIEYDQDLEELGMESIVFVKIIVALEMKYDIEFPDEDLLMSNMKSIRDFDRKVKKLIEEEVTLK